MLDCFCKDKIFLKFYIMFFLFFLRLSECRRFATCAIVMGGCNYIVYVINVRFTEFYVMK